MAPIAVGDTLPDGEVSFFDEEGELQKLRIHDWAKNKKVILVGIPGAYTPVCSSKHIPGFIEHAPELKKYLDDIAVLSVNDAYVMRAWEKTFPGVEGNIRMFADGPGDYAGALGFDVDLSDIGLGRRCRRFSLYAENLKVKFLHLEEKGDFTTSGAQDLLAQLRSEEQQA